MSYRGGNKRISNNSVSWYAPDILQRYANAAGDKVTAPTNPVMLADV